LKPSKLTKKEIREKLPKELSQYVSKYVGTLDMKPLYYTKTIILKEEDAKNLESRVNEILKFEEDKCVIFGIFSNSLKPSFITKTFREKAKFFIKTAPRPSTLGRVWCVEVNGRGKGCGIIAADDKIKIWKDKIIKLPKNNVAGAK
jgi:hypothetical protein